MGIKERLAVKKKLDLELTPSEMVSQEAERIEQELLEDLLATSIRQCLFPPFQLEAIKFHAPSNGYRVRLRGAGQDDHNKTKVVTIVGTIPEEDITAKTMSTSVWNHYIQVVVNAWIARMTDDLRKNGATRLSTSRLDGKSKSLNKAMRDATTAMGALKVAAAKSERTALSFRDMYRQQIYETGSYHPIWIAEPQPETPTAGEVWEAEESIRQSAVRVRRAAHQRRPSKDSA